MPGAALPLEAQSNIDPVNKYAWGENVGWTNWRDANGGADGVLVGTTHLSGFIWDENVGWINVGDGSPASGMHYANTDGTDFGVNVDTNGDLFGFAWGENIGWVNFDTRSKGAERARLDPVAGRFRGYAWGENVGWINLDDGTHFVVVTPTGVAIKPGDANQDGVLDLSDPVALLNRIFTGTPLPSATPGSEDCFFAAGDFTAAGLRVLDWNCDGAIDLSDPVAQLSWQFQSTFPHSQPPGGCAVIGCIDQSCSNCILVVSPDCLESCP